MTSSDFSVFIPLHTPAAFRCDYVLQTVKQLLLRKIPVYIVYYSYSQDVSLKTEKKEHEYLTSFLGAVGSSPLLHVLTPNKLSIPFIRRHISLRRPFFLKIKKAFLSEKSPILWCFDPDDVVLAEYVKKKFTSVRIVYDCVDYFSSLDEKINTKIRKKEKRLISISTYFIVNSHALAAMKGRWRRPDAIVPQGFDLESVSPHLKNDRSHEFLAYKKFFAHIPVPRIGFVGYLSYRIDYNLLLKVCTDFPMISFIFTDITLHFKHDDSITRYEDALRRLKALSNVYLIPPFENRFILRAILPEIDICMIPYDTSFDFNKYSYPMKVFEYFYFGKPVISTPIEELRRFPRFVKIGKTSLEWNRVIKDVLAKKWPMKNQKEQKKLAIENRWEAKLDSILRLLDTE